MDNRVLYLGPGRGEHWLGDTLPNRAGYFSIIHAMMPPKAFKLIEGAYRMAKEAHRKQKRDDGSRYFDHPRRVSLILMIELKIGDWESCVSCLLHDVREDSFMLQAWTIRRLFGKEVLRSLGLLTKDPKEGYLDRLIHFGEIRDWIVKLCDRLDNMRTLEGCPPEKRQKQVDETRKHYLPLADDLIEKLPEGQKWRGIYLKKEIELCCDRWDQKTAA
jgi:GTP diphosphokinase / guanosine-3',5'-bis(diphosphate) 3'-diphosphatase